MARWVRWQPSELDALTVVEFEDYLQEAAAQIRQEVRQNGDR
ncbi:hypothetical protein [Arsenophonus sp. ENCA]|nr:hypothetical protein [Arsenophonus sp. ENCA]